MTTSGGPRGWAIYHNDVIMGAMASQITSLTIVYSTVYSGADHRHQSSASQAFVRGIHRWPVNSPHKCPVNAENVSIWWRHQGFSHKYLQKTIARPLGRGMRCLLWIQHLIDFLHQFLRLSWQYLTILDRVITALDYIYRAWIGRHIIDLTWHILLEQN